LQRFRPLAEAYGDDADLRREVESLLAAHDDAGTFLQARLSRNVMVLRFKNYARAFHG
jgi:hypothetical protein